MNRVCFSIHFVPFHSATHTAKLHIFSCRTFDGYLLNIRREVREDYSSVNTDLLGLAAGNQNLLGSSSNPPSNYCIGNSLINSRFSAGINLLGRLSLNSRKSGPSIEKAVKNP